MAHELMFDPADSWYLKVREFALRFPRAEEKISHGRPAFFTKNIFTMFGFATRTDEGWESHRGVTLLLPEPERLALVDLPECHVPMYWGPWGWIGLDLGGSVSWDEVCELIDESYRQTAPRAAIKELDLG